MPRLVCWLVGVLSVDILFHLAWVWIWSIQRKLLTGFDLFSHSLLDLLKRTCVGHSLLNQPVREQFQRIAFRLPTLFLFFRTIVGPLDVTHMMSMIAVRIAQQKSRPLAPASTLN